MFGEGRDVPKPTVSFLTNPASLASFGEHRYSSVKQADADGFSVFTL